MNNITSALLPVLVLVLLCSCRMDDAHNKRTKQPSPVAAALSGTTNRHTHAIRAGGPHSFVRITNPPASNRASIFFATWSDDGPVFRLTNGEPHAILLWNVRVQVRSTDRGTDGFGWDTVDDDYPMGTVRYNSALYPPGSTGEFSVHHPGKTPWRVCVLYSTDWTDSGKSYSGNYEVISEELKE
jgi:hypothetical protein